jgi:Spy/CpxP family protein refolding chaperone
MNTTIGAWLLGGALVASLGWNAMTLRAPPAAPRGGATPCTAALGKLGDLGLTDAKRAELAALLRKCDEESAAADARAGALARSLNELLREPGSDAATIRARARELAAVRGSAVERCVESTLALRELLDAEQLRQLLDACCDDCCEAR